jgi:hypothetical protein
VSSTAHLESRRKRRLRFGYGCADTWRVSLGTRRYLPWVAGAAAVCVVLLVGAIDQRHTAAKVPTRFSLQGYYRTQQLDNEFEHRAWIYAGVAALAMALAAAVAVARAKRVTDRRRVFAEIGVVGILLGLFGIVLRWQVHSPVEPTTAAVLAPSAFLLAIAGVGGAVSRILRAPPGEPSTPERRLGGVAIVAITCTAITAACALAYGIPQNNDCSGNASSPPGWTDGVASVGYITGLAGIVLAFVSLVGRRWLVALVCFVVNPAAFFYAVYASGAGC